MNLTTAINVFLRQSLRVGGFPFEVKLKQPNKETIAAMLEAEQIAHNPDAPQEDTIYVITPSPLDYGDVETREMVVDRLKYIGATNVQEISVEEALKRLSLLPFVLMIDSSGNFTKAIAASE